jgi:hypothetical protein
MKPAVTVWVIDMEAPLGWLWTGKEKAPGISPRGFGGERVWLRLALHPQDVESKDHDDHQQAINGHGEQGNACGHRTHVGECCGHACECQEWYVDSFVLDVKKPTEVGMCVRTVGYWFGIRGTESRCTFLF